MKKGFRSLLQSKWGIPVLLSFFILIAWLSAHWHMRFDLTNEKRYTLSKGTIELLKKTDSKIKIEICMGGDQPPAFRKLANSALELIEEFNESSGKHIEFQLVKPEDHLNASTTYSESLDSMNIRPIEYIQNTKTQHKAFKIYPVALMSSQDTIIPVELFNSSKPFINSRDLSLDFGKEINQAEALLENKFAEGIYKIQQLHKPKHIIGYAVGHGELLDDQPTSLVMDVIKPNYEMRGVDLQNDPLISSEIDALIILKPTRPFSETDNLKIDQYIMNGGKVLFFAEPLQAEMDTFRIKQRIIPFDQQLKITDIIYHYGARINPKLLLDIQCDYYPLLPSEDGRTFNLIPWNCCPVLMGNPQHPITQNVDLVNSKFANTIELIETKGVKTTVLLQSSAHARTLSQGDIVLGNENVSDVNDKRFKQSNVPVAVLLEGNFTSYFANSITTDQKNYLSQNGMNFKPATDKPGKLLVVSDADVVLNDIREGQPIPMGINNYAFGTDRQFNFANKKFIENALEYLTDDGKNKLMESRNKSFVLRLLDLQKVNNERTQWQLLNLLLPMVIVLIFALFFTQLRKRRFTS